MIFRKTARREVAEAAFAKPASWAWLPWMTAATLAYLLVEMSFNARLLDVAGGMATAEEIDSIEQFGRLISGVAVALALWGSAAAHLPADSFKRLCFLSISGVLLISGTYHGEKLLIDTLVDRSSPDDRRDAAMLSLLSHGIRNGHAKLDGLDLDAQALRDPEGKAFVAMFPMLAISTDDLDEKARKVRSDLLRRAVVSRMGTKEALYNDSFIPSVKALAASYNNYVDGVNRLADEQANVPGRTEGMWNEYLKMLKSKGISSPERVDSRYKYGLVVKGLRERGIAVPEGWAPYDKLAFQRAAADGAKQEADRRFRRVVEHEVGKGVTLPTNLSWGQFVAHPAVQKRWREELNAPAAARLRPTMTADEFSRQIYEPAVAKAVTQEGKRYDALAKEFADGGTQESFGREAVRAMIVPPIALAISLLGAMVHLFKFTNYATQLAAPVLRASVWRRPIIAAAVAGVALSALAVPNAVTTSRIYGYFEDQTEAKIGAQAALAMTWAIQMQPYAYPANELIRTTVLMGYNFGYEDKP